MLIRIQIALIAVVLIVGCKDDRPSQPAPANSSSTTGGGAATSDERFLAEAASASTLVAQAAQSVAQLIEHEEDKKMAKELLEDHSKLVEEIEVLAAKKSVKLAEGMEPAHQQSLAKLVGRKGEALEHAYHEELEKALSQMVTSFDIAAKNASDADVRALATKWSAKLREHAKEMTDHHHDH